MLRHKLSDRLSQMPAEVFTASAGEAVTRLLVAQNRHAARYLV